MGISPDLRHLWPSSIKPIAPHAAEAAIVELMLQPETSDSSNGSATFAGTLAAFALPAQKLPIAWNDDDLGDDVAILTYERALFAHSRYEAPEPGDQAAPEPSDSASLLAYEVLTEDAHQAMTAPTTAVAKSAQPAAPTASKANEVSRLAGRNLMTASITIRLSEAECAQLRQRAADAGLTVSAYLRSCTFEAEALRAMVKDTLAQLRSKSARESPARSLPARQGRVHWLARLWPSARFASRADQDAGHSPEPIQAQA